MDFKEYQEKAMRTDQFSEDPKRSVEVALKNIQLESLALQEVSRAIGECKDSDQKKKLENSFAQKVGDVLWYLTNLCRHNGTSLEQAAKSNLALIDDRYKAKVGKGQAVYVKGQTHIEELPEKIEIAFVQMGGRTAIVTAMANGEALQLGDRINDNSHDEDFYRFHDVFHLAYIAYLGWSPVMRSLFKRKRKSNPTADEIEDGARAGNLEEALTAYIFAHAKTRNMFKDQHWVDLDVLQTIDKLTIGLEVKQCTYQDWEKAIVEGYKVFNTLVDKDGGVVTVDQKNRTLSFTKISESRDCFQKLLSGVPETADQVVDEATGAAKEAAAKITKKRKGSA